MDIDKLAYGKIKMKNWMVDRQWLLTLTLMNIVILSFCGLPAVLIDPIPHSAISIGFYSMAYLSQNFLFACILGMLLWPIFYFIESHRIKIIAAILPEMLVLWLCFINAKVFAFWRIHINTALLHMYFSKGG